MAVGAHDLPPGQGLPALALQGAHQAVVGLVEFLHPFVFQLLSGLVEVETQFRQALQDAGGLLQTLGEARGRVAVVPVGVQGLHGQGIDGLGPMRGSTYLRSG